MGQFPRSRLRERPGCLVEIFRSGLIDETNSKGAQNKMRLAVPDSLAKKYFVAFEVPWSVRLLLGLTPSCIPDTFMPIHGRWLQESRTTLSSTTDVQVSFSDLVSRSVWMQISAMFQQIFLPEVSPPTNTITSRHITRECTLVVNITHVFGIGRLRLEWRLLCLDPVR
jgi:hypothetical protein